VFFENKWQIFATDYSTSYNMVYLNFTDWNAAAVLREYQQVEFVRDFDLNTIPGSFEFKDPSIPA